MARLFLVMFALMATSIAHSQNLESFKDSLTIQAWSGNSVTINESPKAQESLRIMNDTPAKSEILGYRIGVFFDNSPSARASALEAKELFETEFADIKVYMVYENPYFKVSGANCITQEEAVIMLHKIQRVFPKAYIMREQIAITEL